MLCIVLSTVMLNSCKENVGDVYEYDPVVLAPDFAVLSVDYDYDNANLNSESTLTFKVNFVNNEITETVYASVLNFYVNDEIVESVMLESIESKKEYEQIFEWEAAAGEYDFRFEINLSSDGTLFLDEENTANNMQSENIDIPVKKLVAVSQVAVDASVAAAAVTNDASANIGSVLGDSGASMSTEDAVETTFDNNTSIVEIPVLDNTGAVDSTKSVVAIKTNAGATSGKAQEAQTTIVMAKNIAAKEVGFINGNGKLIYTAGTLTYEKMKSVSFSSCEEAGNIELVNTNAKAKLAYTAALDAAILELGAKKGLAMSAQILAETILAFDLTQGAIDNAPTYTAEVLHGAACDQECVDGHVVKSFGYPGFTLTFKDDRNTNVKKVGASGEFKVFTMPASCTKSNNGTYVFEDCGGNQVTYTFNAKKQESVTSQKCTPNVHN